jgi:hypothetical protein
MYFVDVRYLMRNIMILVLYSLPVQFIMPKRVKLGSTHTPKSAKTDRNRIRNRNAGFVD